MYPCYGPQIGLIAELCRRLKNEVPEALAAQLLQLPWPSTPDLPMQSIFSLSSYRLIHRKTVVRSVLYALATSPMAMPGDRTACTARARISYVEYPP